MIVSYDMGFIGASGHTLSPHIVRLIHIRIVQEKLEINFHVLVFAMAAIKSLPKFIRGSLYLKCGI